MMEVSNPVALAAIYLWIGVIGSVYFLRQRLKWRSQGTTVMLEATSKLSARIVNQLEFAIAAVICGSLMLMKQPFGNNQSTLFMAVCVLLIQSLWLLPALQKGEQVYINGIIVPKSGLRKLHLGSDLVKVASLIIYSIKLFN